MGATWPILFKIVENWLSRVTMTSFRAIFFKNETFCAAARVCTDVFLPISGHGWDHIALIIHFLLLNLFLLFVVVSCCFQIGYLLALDSIWSILYCWWSPKVSLSCSWIISMLSNTTSLDLLELIPVIYNLITACPSFFQVMEDWLSAVEWTLSAIILCISVFLPTSWSFAFLQHRALFANFHHY